MQARLLEILRQADVYENANSLYIGIVYDKISDVVETIEVFLQNRVFNFCKNFIYEIGASCTSAFKVGSLELFQRSVQKTILLPSLFKQSSFVPMTLST